MKAELILPLSHDEDRYREWLLNNIQGDWSLEHETRDGKPVTVIKLPGKSDVDHFRQWFTG